MTLSAIPATSSSAPAEAIQPAKSTGHDLSFHDILSALNPLQYLPVVGTVYRAATGDVIPEPLRVGGSLLVSGLLSGPIGLIVNIALTMAEKVTGIDPEKIVADQLRSSTADAAPVQGTPSGLQAAEPAPAAFSPQQLAAYGIRSAIPGAPDAGDAGATDKLNMLELLRLHNASAAYARQIGPIADAAGVG